MSNLEEFWAAQGGTLSLNKTAELFPNLHALNPDTQVWTYLEFKPMRDMVEICVFFKEPGKKKMRIDAEIEGKYLEQDLNATPEQVRIVQWYDAQEAVK